MTSATMNTPQQTDTAQTEIHGDFTVQIDYRNNPTLALWQGRVVNILALGNQEGRSPAFFLRDLQGNYAIAAIGQVQDLPLTQIQQMLGGGENTAKTAGLGSLR